MEQGPFGSPSVPAPSVWRWYIVLCLLLALLNVGLFYLGFWIQSNGNWIERELKMPSESFKEVAVFYMASGVLFAVGNLILPFVPKRPWAWVLHLVNIIAALLTCVLLPIAVPVLIGWLKPAAKEFFEFR